MGRCTFKNAKNDTSGDGQTDNLSDDINDKTVNADKPLK